jgi:hypothetical protein
MPPPASVAKQRYTAVSFSPDSGILFPRLNARRLAEGMAALMAGHALTTNYDGDEIMTTNNSKAPFFPRIILARAKFPLGQVVMTANAANQLKPLDVAEALSRHSAGDWGDICEQDQRENELSLREGFRLLSVYRSGNSTFWIITEADRSVTTVLLPEDY